ncbi:MAG: hypothetical protein ACQETV_00445 [Actinomycetota bacterium]
MGERGDIILEGLARTVGGLLLVALLAFEVGAVVVNAVQLDDAARRAARDAASALETRGSLAAAEVAADDVATDLDDCHVVEVALEEDGVAVTLTRPAPLMLAGRVGPIAEHTVGSATARAPTDL